jgi:hypothetical protein
VSSNSLHLLMGLSVCERSLLLLPMPYDADSAEEGKRRCGGGLLCRMMFTSYCCCCLAIAVQHVQIRQ